jgi:hypothetical protein
LPFGNDGWGAVNPGADELPVATMITPPWSWAAAFRAVYDRYSQESGSSDWARGSIMLTDSAAGDCPLASGTNILPVGADL